jgi:hypothetical protein
LPILAWCSATGGLADQGVGHGRQQLVAAAAQLVLVLQGRAQGAVQLGEVAAEGVQLGAAQLDAVADLLGEDREFRTGGGDAARGDLDVDAEDPEVGQVLAHVLDAARSGRRRPFDTVSASRFSRIRSSEAIRVPTPSTARDRTSPASRKRPSTACRAASRRAPISDPWEGENVVAETAKDDAKPMKTPDDCW